MKTISVLGVLMLAASTASAQVLWDNGPLVTHPAGMANGSDRSAIGPGGTLFGFGAQTTALNRVADDFTSQAGWTLQSVEFFTYQSFAVGSTITGVTLQIWGAAGPGVGAPVWGDATTNVLSSTSLTNIYRTDSTSTTSLDRRIQSAVVNLPNLQLGAGTFWLDWNFSGTAASGPWQPPVSSPNGLVLGNGLQSIGGGAYNPALDGTTQQALPFVISGLVPTPGSLAVLGLGGLLASRRRR